MYFFYPDLLHCLRCANIRFFTDMGNTFLKIFKATTLKVALKEIAYRHSCPIETSDQLALKKSTNGKLNVGQVRYSLNPNTPKPAREPYLQETVENRHHQDSLLRGLILDYLIVKENCNPLGSSTFAFQHSHYLFTSIAIPRLIASVHSIFRFTLTYG